jgi:uncharacterized protein (DUF934 family)
MLNKVKENLQLQLPGNFDFYRNQPDLQKVTSVQLNVDHFTDGRVFSLLRALRERFKFTGDICVAGNLLPDQIDLLMRCGANSIKLTNGLSDNERPDIIRHSYIEQHRHT